jgi:hypothetical protein
MHLFHIPHRSACRACLHPARGQALVLFAVSVVMLLLLVGLAVDGLRVYIAYSQAQRAAEAAALAGVAYLPAYPTSATPAPDGSDATTRAQQVAAQDGFPIASNVVVSPQATPVLALTVTIHLSIPVSLMALIGSAPISSLASATALLLPPIALGDASGSYGDRVENVTQLVAGLSSPYELKERGDPYSVQCESGWSDGSDATHADAATNIYTTIQLHVATNAPQYASGPNCSPGSPGNPDHIPAGFGGLATRTGPVPTGASYLISIPPGGTGYSVWVWNPRFVYTSSNLDSQLFAAENIYTTGSMDDPAAYPQIAYTLFTAPQLYDRSTDVPLAAIWPYASAPDTSPAPAMDASQITTMPALDAAGPDLWQHGCSSDGAWNVQQGGSTYTPPIVSGKGCLADVPNDYKQWVRLGTHALGASGALPAYFRLTVDTNTGYGVHGYGVKVCHNATSAPNCAIDGATITPWNAATMMLQGSATQTYSLASIPAAYAGRQIALNIVPPAAGGVVTYPAWLRMTAVSGQPAIQTSSNGDDLYHGKWISCMLTLPADYSGGEWHFTWIGSNPPPSTLMTISAALIGSPIMLAS